MQADFLYGAGAFSLPVLPLSLSACLFVFLVMIQCDTIPICLDGDCKIQSTNQIHEIVSCLPSRVLAKLTGPPRIF